MIPQTLYNTNLFVDGVNFAGDVPSLTLPKLTIKTDEYRGGGMAGAIEMAQGLEKMESSFVTKGVRRESLKHFGLADGTAFNATFRGAFRGQKGAVAAVVATIRGLLKEVDLGDWKAGDPGDQARRCGVLLQARNRRAPHVRNRYGCGCSSRRRQRPAR